MKKSRLILILSLLFAVAEPALQGSGGEPDLAVYGNEQPSAKNLAAITSTVEKEICWDFVRTSPLSNLIKMSTGFTWYAPQKITRIEFAAPDDVYVAVGFSSKVTASFYRVKKEGENWVLTESY